MASILNKKKSPVQKLVENIPQPQVTTTPSAPIEPKKINPPEEKPGVIDLTKDERMKKLLAPYDPELQRLRAEKPVQTEPKKMRNKSTGEVVGVVFPNGESFPANYQDADLIINDWKRKQIEEEQAPNVSPEAISGIGTPQLIPGDELTANIMKTNIDKENQPPQVLGELSKLLPGGRYTKTAVNLLSDTPDMKQYFNEYSQSENYARVKDNIDLGFESISIAKDRATRYGDQESIRIYNKAQGELRKSYRDLYIMTQSSPEKFTPEVINQMAELKQYFDEKQANDNFDMNNIITNFNINRTR